ncbi:MAG: hypothetical protein ACYDBV_08230 [Nitrospiria bacterium]
MKSIKSVFMGLSVLVLTIGLFRYTLADVVFPNIFTAGTTVSASQMNANFAQINQRQVATLASMAGIWRYTESGAVYTVINNVTALCNEIANGTMILDANGGISIKENEFTLCPGNTSISPPFTDTVTGTYSINADGSGAITVGSTTRLFQTSKDLNQMVLLIEELPSGATEATTGTALRQ